MRIRCVFVVFVTIYALIRKRYIINSLFIVSCMCYWMLYWFNLKFQLYFHFSHCFIQFYFLFISARSIYTLMPRAFLFIELFCWCTSSQPLWVRCKMQFGASQNSVIKFDLIIDGSNNNQLCTIINIHMIIIIAKNITI